MCYAGGPYCPKVATAKLTVATKERDEYQGTNKDVIKALDKGVNIATIDYMTTTKGIKELKEKAKASGDPKDKEHAEFFVSRRKQLVAQNNKAEPNKGKSKLPLKKSVPLVYSTQASYPVYNAPFEEPVFYGNRGLSSVEYDSDGNYCSGTMCDQEVYDDYCRDGTYENLRVEVTVLFCG